MLFPDENELLRIEEIILNNDTSQNIISPVCDRASLAKLFELLSKQDKQIDDYETLVVRDSQLGFGTLETNSLKYLG